MRCASGAHHRSRHPRRTSDNCPKMDRNGEQPCCGNRTIGRDTLGAKVGRVSKNGGLLDFLDGWNVGCVEHQLGVRSQDTMKPRATRYGGASPAEALPARAVLQKQGGLRQVRQPHRARVHRQVVVSRDVARHRNAYQRTGAPTAAAACRQRADSRHCKDGHCSATLLMASDDRAHELCASRAPENWPAQAQSGGPFFPTSAARSAPAPARENPSSR